MPRSPEADRPHVRDEDSPLDARTPDGALPTEQQADAAAPSDPADQIPVPIAMSPAEIDERAQAVEAVRSQRGLEPRTEV